MSNLSTGSKRLWRTSPLTYIALLLAVLSSLYPLYYMFVIATRSNDAINATPPPFSSGKNPRPACPQK